MANSVDDPVVVILGAGKPFAGIEPSALIQTSGGRRALDWLLEAFTDTLDNPEIHFVGGYRMEEIVDEYPEIHFSRNEDWEQSGTVASLFTAPIPTGRPVYICYADTIFEQTAVSNISTTADATIAIDRSWQTRYRSRSEESLRSAEKISLDDGALLDAGTDLSINEADGEFTGLTRLSPGAVEQAQKLWQARTIDEAANLPALLRALRATNITVETVDIGDAWAELDTAEDLSRFVLDTKANTLRRLQSMVEESTILEQYTFTVEDWNTDPETITDEICTHFDGCSVIVRSSALAEDGWEESNAGRFESVLNVPSADTTKLSNAIDEVISSYPDSTPNNQVLVQPMVDDVAQSGVIMTRNLDGGSPYYVINYDATTNSTESVTDGTGAHLQTAVVRKDIATEKPDQLEDNETQICESEKVTQYPGDLELNRILQAVRELEILIGHDSLDVEFTVDSEGTVYILQARPMTLDPAENTVDDQELYQSVDAAKQEFADAQSAAPHLLGDRTIYGVMPDWNPAEIIGRQPRRLAASLYRYLIMNETWATQRAEYGYRDVRPHPLMKSFAGQPYVDVRADFNSFIPASVPDNLAERIVNYYLNRLEANPELHDKIEFDIAITCLPFDYDHRIEPFLEAGFTKEELEPFRTGLQEITHGVIVRIDDDLAAVDRLDSRYDELVQEQLPPLRKAYHLLEDCRRLGTLPFAHLARTAFVATSLLRSLERKGVLTEQQRTEFQNALNTVARQFERDAYRVASDNLTWEAFVDKYGHLRPGTYELTSPSYAEQPEEYLRPIVETASEPEEHPDPVHIWDSETKSAIENELEDIGLPADADRFIEFLVDAIEGREHSKFVFSRNLSDALECLAEYGEKHGFTRNELSHVPIESFMTLTLDRPAADIETWLSDRVREGREHHAMTQSVELPPLLFDERDFLLFERPSREPNYVTNESVRADGIELSDETESTDLDGKIVLIPQADPGYDWVFGHDIAGLITMYGGANSHMAVRAAEFSLPAAIGVGENRYEQLRRGEVIELNCEGLTIRVVQ